MGFLFYIKSVALVEDLGLEEHHASPVEFYVAADRAYDNVRDILRSPEFHLHLFVLLECS